MSTLTPSLWYGGNPELVSNGTFDSNVTGWTNSSANVTVQWDTNRLKVSQVDPGTGYAYQAVTTVVGKQYRVRATLVSKTSSFAYVYVGTTAGGSTLGSATNTSADIVFIATSTTTYISLVITDELSNAIFDNVSMKEEPIFFATVTNVNNVVPPLFTNTNSFFTPAVSLTLYASLFTNSATFYAPTVLATYSLAAPLITNTEAFYSPVVTRQELLVPAYVTTNYSKFYTPSVDAPVKRALKLSSFSYGRPLPSSTNFILNEGT